MVRQSLIKPLVFGGIDGLTTTLALVWGSIAAGEQMVSSSAVLILGVANLMATALSMGIGDYVGTLAEFEAQLNDHGSSSNTSSNISGNGTSPSVLGGGGGGVGGGGKPLSRSDVKAAAMRSGLTMFAAFVAFGGMPLLPYLPAWVGLSSGNRRVLSTILCASSFFVLGYVRSRMEGAHQWSTALRTSSHMLAMGMAAALMSFFSSKGIYWLLGVDETADTPKG